MSYREWAIDADHYEDWGNDPPADPACTCSCRDCIECTHCGVGYPNPDGSPTICLYPPPDDEDDDNWDDDERMAELFDLLEMS